MSTLASKAKTAEQKFQERCLAAATAELQKLQAQHRELLTYVFVAKAAGASAEHIVDKVLKDFYPAGGVR